MSKALVVLSGGQDSTTCLFWAVRRYGLENVSAITFDYGQRHRREIEAAMMAARLAGIQRHTILVVGEILAGKSPLTNPSEELETYEDFESMDAIIGKRVEKTFVPMRNALFLTLAANHAYCQGANIVVTGVCQSDNANYPDCRSSFINAMNDMIYEALGDSFVDVVAPLLAFAKSGIVELAVDAHAYGAMAYTHTAYDGQYPPIGKDHASVLRAHGFEEAGLPDPLVLRAVSEGLMEMPTGSNYTKQLIEKGYFMAGEDLSNVRPALDPWWETHE